MYVRMVVFVKEGRGSSAILVYLRGTKKAMSACDCWVASRMQNIRLRDNYAVARIIIII